MNDSYIKIDRNIVIRAAQNYLDWVPRVCKTWREEAVEDAKKYKWFGFARTRTDEQAEEHIKKLEKGRFNGFTYKYPVWTTFLFNSECFHAANLIQFANDAWFGFVYLSMTDYKFVREWKDYKGK